MALAELDHAKALELATEFKLLPGFPWDAIDATAKDLVRWCVGAIVNNRVYPPEAQARWLVTEARETWDKWQGTAALYSIFRAKYAPRAPQTITTLSLEETIARGLIRPPCEFCDDSGFIGRIPNVEFCGCPLGRHQWQWMGDHGLRKLNTESVPRKRPGTTLMPFTPITEARMKQALEDERIRRESQLKKLGLD